MDSTKPTRRVENFGLENERRREPRVARSLPIGVSGFDGSGQFFTERTSTVDVSNVGCRFGLGVGRGKSSVISIRVIREENGLQVNSPPVMFRLAWAHETDRGCVLGAEQVEQDRPWSVHFPS